jgi:hypothetical protein
VPTGAEIVASDPPDGFVDTGQVHDSTQSPDGIRTITVQFNMAVDVSTNCLQIITTGGNTPAASVMAVDDTVWLIELDQPIPAGETTAFAFGGGALSVIVHSHPGDINLDGVTDGYDITALEEAIATGPVDPDRHDFNRDGHVGIADSYGLVDQIGEYMDHIWDDGSAALLVCCCAQNSCSVGIGAGCGAETTEVTCPCIPNPCQVAPQ